MKACVRSLATNAGTFMQRTMFRREINHGINNFAPQTTGVAAVCKVAGLMGDANFFWRGD